MIIDLKLYQLMHKYGKLQSYSDTSPGRGDELFMIELRELIQKETTELKTVLDKERERSLYWRDKYMNTKKQLDNFENGGK